MSAAPAGTPGLPGEAPDRDTPARVVAEARLPSRFGEFRAFAFAADAGGKEHLALVRGAVRGARDVPVRIHSECLTGDVLGSLRCDCRDQLIASLRAIGRLPRGIVLYLRQEGRGIGLANKIRAYALQDQGLDTIDANRMLGFDDDERDYGIAAAMLAALGVEGVRLMTNNPAKLRGLREHGVRIAGRIPLVMRPNRHNAGYLETKRRRAGHWLDLPGVLAGAFSTDPARAHPRADRSGSGRGDRPVRGGAGRRARRPPLPPCDRSARSDR